MYGCNTILDPLNKGCSFVSNLDVRGDLSVEDYMSMQMFPYEAEAKFKLDQVLEDTNADVLGKIQTLAQTNSNIRKLLNLYMRIAQNDPTKVLGLAAQAKSWDIPSFTEDLLRSACKAPATILTVDANTLFGENSPESPMSRPYYPAAGMKVGKCNHAVFLASCDEDKDVYKIWTWGAFRYLSRGRLLGNPVSSSGDPNPAGPFNTGAICSAVTARELTFV
eukprot:TRINITY_DN98096_c0_g1_i1.p1 TRINITY_DN98096_c0_g1~~TRINITY_DN98096_c0_g1_i1.p1  ORF type:complete len:221 (-),score=31.41 TRINITY_DN98096_c0_g1_i1:84-746(-)